MSLLKCLNKFIVKSQREEIVGIVWMLNQQKDINGNKVLLIFIIHLSSNKLKNNYLNLEKFKMPIAWHGSEIQLQLTTYLQQEILQRTHQQPDIWNKKEFNLVILILMEPEEETMRLWQEEHSQTQELLINLHQKWDLKLHIYLVVSFLIFMMLLTNIINKAINS